jgi:hypothetical protein
MISYELLMRQVRRNAGTPVQSAFELSASRRRHEFKAVRPTLQATQDGRAPGLDMRRRESAVAKPQRPLTRV